MDLPTDRAAHISDNRREDERANAPYVVGLPGEYLERDVIN